MDIAGDTVTTVAAVNSRPNHKRISDTDNPFVTGQWHKFHARTQALLDSDFSEDDGPDEPFALKSHGP
jgi:hypothetical protein